MRKNLHVITTIWLFMLLFSLQSASAVPVPHGVDGYIFEPDGQTQITGDAWFRVTDLDSGYRMQGKVGMGRNTGRYSCVISGNDGDAILIEAWSQESSANASLVLNGVMHNFNMLLNTTLRNKPPVIQEIAPAIPAYAGELFSLRIIATDPEADSLTYSLETSPVGMDIGSADGIITWTPADSQIGENHVTVSVSDGNHDAFASFVIIVSRQENLPPVFTTAPVDYAYEGSPYAYDASAADPEGSAVSYYLISSPSGMSINAATGVVSWTPSQDDTGNSRVIIAAADSDGGVSTQEYLLQVIDVDSPPVILSSPETYAVVKRYYTYQIEAYDPDSDGLAYSLLASPPGMGITSGGLITWTPKSTGYFDVAAAVSDGQHTVNQSFTVFVNKSQKENRRKDKRDFIITTEDSDSPVTQLLFRTDYDAGDLDVSIHYYASKPRDLAALGRFVYRYLKIEKNQDSDGDWILSFRVNSSWMKQYKINPYDIVLYRMVGPGWVALETDFRKLDSEYGYFESTTPGFSYFAIATEGEPSFEPEEAPSIREPYVILGTIAPNSTGNPDKIKVTVENKDTGERVAGVVEGGDGSRYAAVIHGSENDTILVRAESQGEEKESSMQLTGGVIRKDLQLERKSAGAVLAGYVKYLPIIIITLSLLIYLIYRRASDVSRRG